MNDIKIENKNKRGQTGFLIFIIVGIIIAFIFAIVVIPVAYMGDEIFNQLKQPQNFGSDNETVAQINIVQGFMTGAFDQLVFFTLFAVFLGLIVLAVFTDFHPIVLIFLIVVIILLVIVGGLLANVFGEVSNTPILSAKASEFHMTNLVMGSQLPILIAVMGAIAIIIMLAKRGRATSPV